MSDESDGTYPSSDGSRRDILTGEPEETFCTETCKRGEHAECDSFICGCPCHE